MNPEYQAIKRDVLRTKYAPQSEYSWREKASRLSCPYTMAAVLVIGVVAAAWAVALIVNAN